MAILLRKQQAEKVANKLREFEQNFDGFVTGRIPCSLAVYGFFRDKKCTDWLRKTADGLKDTLRDLYSKHDILPAGVLYLLAEEWWFIYAFKTPNDERESRLEKILSDTRGRAVGRSVKILEAAMREVDTWSLVAWELFNIDWTKPAVTMDFHNSIDSRALVRDLDRLRDNIVQLRKRLRKKGQPPKVQARQLARNLAALFKECAGRPHYEEIAEIFALTWPLEWKRPHSNNADTIENLVNDGPPPLPGPNLRLDYAIALQHSDPEYVEHWRRLDEERQRVLKASGRAAARTAARVFDNAMKKARAKNKAISR